MISTGLLQFSSDEKKKLFEKVARFEVMGVDDIDACRILGFGQEKLKEIRDDDRYKIIYAAISQEKLEEIDTLNRGWDAVEDKALERILVKLQISSDPEYALKAALVANKAKRKPANTRVVDASNHGGRANISLNNTFILKLQDKGIEPKTIDHSNHKNQDFMGADKVEKMLTAPKNDEVELDFIPDQQGEVIEG